MIDAKLASELAEKFFNNLPGQENINVAKEDVAKTIKLVLEQSLNKLDLVTREQFDVQCKVLAQTRQELEQLELKVKELQQF